MNDSLELILEQIRLEIKSSGLEESGFSYDISHSEDSTDDVRDDLYSQEEFWRK